ncbi:MAG: hypothetical protein AB7G52_11070 [Arcobacter sp.]
MSRITDSVLAKDTVYAGHGPALNLTYGGQNGFMPRIGLTGPDGKSYEEWISNHAYIKKNIIPVVIRYPKFMDFMPDKEKWIATYKALIELHPLTIDGLTSGLTVEFDEHPIGGAGEMQEELTDVKRARSTVTMTFKEKAGKAIQKFLDYVIRYGMMDPDTKKPLVTRYMENIEAVGGMYTPDYYTGTVLFIEPDTTHKVVVDAWLCSNMAPKSNGDRTGKRDIRSAGEAPELSIEWTSITMNNEAVLNMADKVLKDLTIINKVPDLDLVLPSTEVDATVKAGATGFNQYN